MVGNHKIQLLNLAAGFRIQIIVVTEVDTDVSCSSWPTMLVNLL